MSTRTLSESQSKQLLAGYGVPLAGERRVTTADEAVTAAAELGFPVVAKLNGDGIAHKTERGLVRLDLADAGAVHRAASDLLAAATPSDGDVDVLVAPMIRGNRELIVGVLNDPQFGPTVMLGVGGILAEAVADVVFRPAPVDDVTAHEMIDQLATQRLLGEFRGEAAVDRAALAAALVALGRVVVERPDVVSVDVNPLIVGRDGMPVAVDALVEVGDEATVESRRTVAPDAVARAVRRVVRTARRARRRGVVAPRQVRLRGHAQPARPAATRAPSTARTCRAKRSSASPPCPTRRRCPTTRSTSSWCAPQRRRTWPCSAPARRRAPAPRS